MSSSSIADQPTRQSADTVADMRRYLKTIGLNNIQVINVMHEILLAYGRGYGDGAKRSVDSDIVNVDV